MVVVKLAKHNSDLQLQVTHIPFLVVYQITLVLPVVLVVVELLMVHQLTILTLVQQGDILVEQEDLILHLISRDILVVKLELCLVFQEHNLEVAVVVPVEVVQVKVFTLRDQQGHLPEDMIPEIGIKTQVEMVEMVNLILNFLVLDWH
jgi:hypothetical protein